MKQVGGSQFFIHTPSDHPPMTFEWGVFSIDLNLYVFLAIIVASRALFVFRYSPHIFLSSVGKRTSVYHYHKRFKMREGNNIAAPISSWGVESYQNTFACVNSISCSMIELKHNSL